MLPNPHLLIRPFLRQEAILSSQIEGTYASIEQLLLFEASPSAKTIGGSGDVQEVSNYVASLNFGLARLGQIPISLRLIRELHEHLMENVRGQDKRPGEFRRIQNYIGRQGQPPAEARFVPPPPTEVLAAMQDLEKFIHAPSNLPTLIKIALIHYQFEAIHPFGDGNGRIGRLLIALQFCERNLLPTPLLYLSRYFDENRDEYMHRLLRISLAGEWNQWTNFFLQGVAQEARHAIVRSKAMLALWDDYRKRVQVARVSPLASRLVDELFSYPLITISRAGAVLGVTPRSAQKNVFKLVESGILEEMPIGGRSRYYFAREIVDVSRPSSSS
jgi:Fic family protein